MKSVLTLWFVLATLLGPGVCCCSWVAAKANAQPHKSPRPAALKPTKSCCSTPAVPTRVVQSRGEEPAGDPAKCPCKSHKKIAESNAAAVSAPDLTGQLRLAEWVAVAFVPADAAVAALGSHHVTPADGALPLGGRGLLTAYHILLC
jgi:hypothetical protein